MDELRIENLRSLKDTGFIKLHKINVLVGQNSSGKSTFARAFPLLKQSLQEKTKSGILWYGPFADFGSFDEAISNSKTSAKDTVNFTFVKNDLEVRKSNVWQFHRKLGEQKNSVSRFGRVELTCRVFKDTQKKFEFILRIKDRIVNIILSQNSEIVKFELDNSNLKGSRFGFLFHNSRGMIPMIFPAGESDGLDLADSMRKALYESLSLVSDVSEKAIEQLSFDDCLDDVQLAVALKCPGDAIHAGFREKVSQYITIREFPYIWDGLRDEFYGTVASVQYVTPIRASAERYYRMQGLSVEELDPQGTNLAMFLHSLTAAESKKFSSWTREHMGFSVQSKSTEGHVSILIVDEDNKKINMADTGFGFSQVIPILAQIWKATVRDNRAKVPIYYVIEQPELHLHPKMQARLADILIAAINSSKSHGIKLIIETHSETFINQLGKAVEKSSLAASDVGVYLFQKDGETGVTSIVNSPFDEQGFLTKWPYGFFDS